MIQKQAVFFFGEKVVVGVVASTSTLSNALFFLDGVGGEGLDFIFFLLDDIDDHVVQLSLHH